MGAGVTKATRGQSNLKAVQEREVFTADKCKRDRPTGGKGYRPLHVFVFELRGRVWIGGQNLFAKCVRIGKCSSQRVFKPRGTTVFVFISVMFGKLTLAPIFCQCWLPL